jgi:hypothetical protein
MPATEQASNIQPADRAVRAAGALYLLLVVTSIFGLISSQSLIVPNDASATAHNIRSSETLFRLALVSSLIASIAFVFLARELDRLLSEVNTTQASLMVVLVLLSIPISFVSWLNEIAALRLIDGPALSGMGTSQMNGLASFFLGLSSDHQRPQLHLFRAVAAAAGGAYLVGTLKVLLSAPLGPVVSGIVTVGYLGELGVVAWLVFKAAQVQFGEGKAVIRNRTKNDPNFAGGNAW